MSGKQAVASDCHMIRDESFYANEAGVNKTMGATRPVSGASERGRVKQWQGQGAGCIEIGSKDTICLLHCNNHRHRAGNIAAANLMANCMVVTGRVLLVVVNGGQIMIRGKMCMMHMLD